MRWRARDRNSQILGGILLLLGAALVIASLPGWFWIALCGLALARLGWYVIAG